MEHQNRSAELEKSADDLEEGSERRKGEIDEAKSGWESRKGDPSVPGAQDPAEDLLEGEPEAAGAEGSDGEGSDGEGSGAAEDPGGGSE